MVGNASINTNADTEIQVSEATAFTDAIDVSSMTIADLTGIEAFTALTVLYCYENQLTSLDVSANTALISLNCNSNLLTSLNVSGATALNYLGCGYNPLTSLNVSANTALIVLNCSYNLLTGLDVSANTALTHLWCSDNLLTSLDVSANTALTWLDCRSNQLTSLNVSANTALTILECSYNQLTSLNVSGATALTYLECYSNLLTSLNVSANTALNYFLCNSNLLTSLDVKNGNNINFFGFNATNNPNLICIQVDNAAWSTANWTVANGNIDATASFSTNCPTGIEQSSIINNQFSVYPNPSNGMFQITSNELRITNIEIVNLLGEKIFEAPALKGVNQINVFLPSGTGKGIYFIKIISEQGTATKKLILQ